MTDARSNNATLLWALIAAAVGTFLILRTGFTPTAVHPVGQATNAPVHAERLPDDVVSGQLMDEHRALEAAQLVAVSVAGLKALYLDCVRSTSEYRMDVEEAVYCQAVAETLMHRHFNGSMEQLLSWWRSQPSPPQALNRAKDT